MNYHIPPFPVHVLPDRLRHFVINASASLNCPEDFMGVFGYMPIENAVEFINIHGGAEL